MEQDESDWERKGCQPVHPQYSEDISFRYSLDAITVAASTAYGAQDVGRYVEALIVGQNAIVSAIHEQTYVLKEAIDALREAIERQK